MVGEDLDKHIQDYLGYFRSAAAVINTAVIIASAKGILCTRSQFVIKNQCNQELG